MGWLYTHLVAANSGIPVHVSSSQVNLLNDASDALNGVEHSFIPHNGNGSSAAEDSSTETSVLLPKSISAKLNDSIQTFMAMYVLDYQIVPFASSLIDSRCSGSYICRSN